MTVARKFHVEGPIGKQLSKTEYSKMLKQVDALMQKGLTRKKGLTVESLNNRIL
jgi:hypothetical protein